MKLRSKISMSFLLVIALFSASTLVMGYYIVNKYVVGEVQKKVNGDLKTARAAYDSQLNDMKLVFALATPETDLDRIRDTAQLDYLFLVPADRIAGVKSVLAERAYENARTLGGNRLIAKDELDRMGWGFQERALIEIKNTPKARPRQEKVLETAMAIEVAKPFINDEGEVTAVIYGGKIINKNFQLIDSIADSVFENKLYDEKPVGTVTVFLDDVRVATNVLDDKGHRAIGTRVSQIVYDRVIAKGEKWLDRAFVVTDWYRTAYEPIKNVDGKTIGILYVGILEKPFVDLQRNIFIGFLGIIAATGVLAIFLSYFLTSMITRPMVKLLQATAKFSEGDLDYRIDRRNPIQEFDLLVDSFNLMAEKISDREKSIAASKEQVEVLNKRYLDLVGFVSHELKGILSSIVLNIYLLQNKLLGEINEKQEKTLRSVARNLDYLTNTVKNFLNLSRIEKGELALNKTELLLREHVIDVAVESFAQQAADKGVEVINEVAPGIKFMGDSGLLQIVANNLLSNAIKYGVPGGKIKLTSQIKKNMVQVEFYNDGKPIADIDLDKLFRKFSRLVYTGMEKVKGTGVGLFITKEILEQHGGTIWAVPRESGNSFIFQLEIMKA